jgi:SLT domain-containing protein
VSPLGLVAVAITGIVFGFSELYKHNEKFRAWADGVISDAKRVAKEGFGFLSRTFGQVQAGFSDQGSARPDPSAASGPGGARRQAAQTAQNENNTPASGLTRGIRAARSAISDFFGPQGTGREWINGFVQWSKPVLSNLGQIFSSAFTIIVQIIRFEVAVAQFIWQHFGDLFTKIAKQAWNFIAQIIDGALQFIAGILNFFADLLTGKWGKLWGDIKQIVSGAWRVIWATIKFALVIIVFFFNGWWREITIIWDAIWDGIKAATKSAWDAIGSVLGSALDGIKYGFSLFKGVLKSIWDGITEIFKAPIRLVVNGVIKPFVGALNFIGKPFGLQVTPPTLPRGFAVGGRTPGPDLGRDSQLTPTRGDEHITTPEEVRALGGGNIDRGHQMMVAFRSALMGGRPVATAGDGSGYSTGGQVIYRPDLEHGGVPGIGIVKKIGKGAAHLGEKAAGFALDAAGNLIGDVNSAITSLPGIGPLVAKGENALGDILREGAAHLLNLAVGPLRAILSKLGSTFPARLVQHGFDTIVNKAADWLQGAQDASSGDPSGALGGAIQAIIDVMRKSAINGWVVTSSLRPGDPGYHGSGNAVDFGWPGNDPAGLTRIARYWDQYRGSLLEEIYSGDGGHFGKDGKTVNAGFYGSATVSEHYNHVHIAATLAAMQRILSGAGTAISCGVGGVIQRALQIAHLPATWSSALQILLNKETSGGQDLTNYGYTANGEHPTGPAQFLPSTFRQFALPGYGNIHALLDSLIAAARRINQVWKGPQNIPGLLGGGQYQGYYYGGTIQGSEHGTVVRLAERNRTETITDTASLNRVVDLAQEAQAAASRGGHTIIVNPSADMDENDLAQKVDRTLAWNSR